MIIKQWYCLIVLLAFPCLSRGLRYNITAPFARNLVASVSARDAIFFLGGDDGSNNCYSAVVNIYNITTQKWSTTAMAEQKCWLAVSTDDTYIYVGGGYHTGFVSYRMEVYHIPSGVWYSGSYFLTGYAGRYAVGTTVYPPYVVFGGGILYTGAVGNQAEFYNVYTGAAVPVTLAIPRWYVTMGTVGTWVFFAGGFTTVSYTTTNYVDVWDAAIGFRAPLYLSVARAEMGTVTVGNLLFFAGGALNVNTPSNAVDIFDFSTKTWTVTTMPTARFNTKAFAINNNLVMFYSTWNGAGNTIDVYNIATRQWTVYNIPSRFYTTCAANNGVVYCLTSMSTTVDVFKICPSDQNCDGLYCNGPEVCDEYGFCTNISLGSPCGTGPCNSVCNETQKTCNLPRFSSCSDGLYCNGNDYCDGAGTCLHTGNPCVGKPICNDQCNEINDNCYSLLGTNCSNGDPCKVNDLCNGVGGCVPLTQGVCVTTGAITTGTTGTTGTTEAAISSSTGDSPADAIKPSKSKSSNGTVIIAAAASVGGIVVLAALAVIAILLVRRGKRKSKDDTSDDHYVSMIPTRVREIKDIKIQGRLGGGAFGDVYKGVMDQFTAVALKNLKTQGTSADFHKEVEILCNLNHPHIVRLFGIHTSNQTKYMVLEYVSGGNLLELVRQNPNLTSVELLVMAEQTCLGMAYLEENKIVHRDLALRNLLYSKEGNKYHVKVTDFGLSSLSDSGSRTSTDASIKMPVRWTAPEVLQSGVATSKSDTWSFGVVLWELFANGANPYSEFSSNDQVIEKVCNGHRLRCPSKCDSEIYNVMNKCWLANPEARPTFETLLKMLIHAIPPEHVVTVQAPRQTKVIQTDNLYHTITLYN